MFYPYSVDAQGSAARAHRGGQATARNPGETYRTFARCAMKCASHKPCILCDALQISTKDCPKIIPGKVFFACARNEEEVLIRSKHFELAMRMKTDTSAHSSFKCCRIGFQESATSIRIRSVHLKLLKKPQPFPLPFVQERKRLPLFLPAFATVRVTAASLHLQSTL